MQDAAAPALNCSLLIQPLGFWRWYVKLTVRLLAVAAVLLSAARADIVWFDGTRSAGGPPGKLLSDNDGYWGDCVLTGVTYSYERQPDNPADTYRDKPDTFGRRLLDGRPTGNWWTSVGVTGPLTVTLDFKRECEFAEVDIDTRSKRVGVEIAVADSAEGPWRTVFARPVEDCPDAQFHRLPLAQVASGRFLRLTVEAPGVTWLDEVLVWGEAEVSADAPEAVNPVTPPPARSDIAFQSITGIDRTAFPDAAYWDWQRSLGLQARQRAVWSQVPTWDSITDRALLPRQEDLRQEVSIVMARNETECAALALTNTSWEEPWNTTISLSPFRGQPVGLSAEVRVAGAIASRFYGVNLGPLFSRDNMLPPSLMQRYLTNGSEIAGFPRVTLPRAGSLVLWVEVTTANARPGEYVARLECDGGPGVRLRVRVLDVTLPEPRVWLQTYSGITWQFPFEDANRKAREVAYKTALGVTVWNGFPEQGTLGELARVPGRSYYHVWGLDDYGHRLYNHQIDPEALGPEDEERIAEIISRHVAKAQTLGLGYDDWYIEITDEPGEGNSPAFGALCRLVRKANPRVRIYCNPSFWVGNGCLPDEPVFNSLGPWYNDCVDVSCPIYILLRDRPKCEGLFDAPRLVRAFYNVCTQSAKSERSAEVELYRRMAWDAFARGWNGWGFYAYFAPRGNPWTDFDADWYTGEDLPDYTMVYPGPYGPIPTRQSEAVRQGWEDYCLLTALKERGKGALVRELLSDYETGRPIEELRLRALNALGK